MLKKKLAFGLRMMLTVGTIVGCGAKHASSSTSNELKIGVVVPLTGDVATYGQSGKNGLELLAEEVNKAGGVLGKNVKFVYGDDEGKPANSVTVLKS
jgi:branched-chain amino acid transport system substrate-binding protein